LNKDTKTLEKDKQPTPTTPTPLSTETGSLDSTKLSSATSNVLPLTKFAEEAKQFKAKKRYNGPPKPMTSRIYLLGMAMNALLSRSQGPVRKEEIKREAEEWADYMLED